MVPQKYSQICRAIIGTFLFFMLFASAGMKDERSLVIAAQSTRVNIEILPGSSKFIDASRPFVPVAILGSEGFDAANVNPFSIRLAGAPITKKKNGLLRARLRDINGDGRIDLVVYVSVSSLHLDEGT